MTGRDYGYSDANPTWSNGYIWPVLERELKRLRVEGPLEKAFDLGCGNGATVGMLARLGIEATGVDTSETGIAHARSAFPDCRFEIASAYDDLAARFGQFPLVVSLEVVEHLYDPRTHARKLFDLVEPGGHAFVSTPYHGYLKNLALAISGKLETHFSALWDGGHIKFFSIPTLRQLLEEPGFRDIRFVRVGRSPPLAKSMVAIAARPQVVR
jgi:2-polyprenyl-3-methyl-5-hydroxy-6-metoxy-1,4-benzoquinol methylase